MEDKKIDIDLFNRWLFVQKWKAGESGDREALKALCETKEEVTSFLKLKGFLKKIKKRKEEENSKRMVSLEAAFSGISAE